jgi:hypothetical protein
VAFFSSSDGSRAEAIGTTVLQLCSIPKAGSIGKVLQVRKIRVPDRSIVRDLSLDPVERWKDALKLDALGGPFDGFLESIVVNQKKWKAWYDEETPEAVPMPSGYSDKLSKFQQLLVCRVFRQDRVINAIKGFILERMGPNYIQSPPIVYEKIYQGASEKTPIVFVLSPGADPQSEVQRLAEDKGFANKFQHLALGAGME